MKNLTDLDLICLYAMVGGLNGQQVIDSLKEEQLNTTYSDKAQLLLQKLQHSASKGHMWDLTDVPYLKLRLELVKRGLLGGDVKKLKARIKELEETNK